MRSEHIVISDENTVKWLQPLQMTWKPQKDITAYELALCMIYFNRSVMPYEVDKKETHFRHFEIVDHNENH